MNANLDDVGCPVDAPLRPAPAARAAHARFWLGGSRTGVDLSLALPDACVDELDAALARLPTLADGEQPGDTTLDADVRAALARTAAFAGEVRERLEHGAGAAIVDRFPAERWNDADNRRVAGIFSELVAPLEPQAFDGTKLYDVMDKKVRDVGAVRRSVTNLAQAYHTDGPWVKVPARYIGLYCIRSAGQGGDSRVTSLLCAADALRAGADGADGEALFAELERAQPWDRQGEHAPGDTPWEAHPIFAESEEGVVARFYESYVRRGHELAGRSMSPLADAALAGLGSALEAQPAVRFLMEPGQFQYANNYTVAHARDAFEDDPEAPGGRRLVRVWHR